MAEGSYGSSPFYQTTVSPIEPSKPSSKFATNVSRKKTRKWVEAKTINYDGAGWGDDDDEDEDEQPPEPAAPVSTHANVPNVPATRNLPSMTASAAAAPQSAAASSSAAAPPGPLRVGSPALRARQGGSPARSIGSAGGADASRGPSPFVPSPSAAASGPSSSRSGPLPPATTAAGPSGSRPPWTDNRSQSPLGPRAQSPATTASGAAGWRGHFVRPSDIYKRAASSSEDVHPNGGERGAEARGRNDTAVAPAAPAAGIGHSAPSVSPTRPPPQPQHQQTRPSIPPSASNPVPLPSQHKPQASADSTASSAADEAGEMRRFSTSPKLPDLARFSTFSPDLLFGGSSFLSSDAPPVPAIPSSAVTSFPPQGQDAKKEKEKEKEKETTPTASSAAVSLPSGRLHTKHQNDSISSTGDSVAAARDSTVTAATATTANTVLSDEPSSRFSDASASGPGPGPSASSADYLQKFPATTERLPLDTLAIENEKVLLLDRPTAASAAQPSSAQVTPTEPLNPRRFITPIDVSVPVVAPPDLSRTATISTVTSSPQKESDKLREEIIRTLSPIKSAASDGEGSDRHGHADSARDQTPGEPVRQLTRESTYLQNVYDDYWTADDASGTEHGHGRTPSVPSIPPLSPSGAPFSPAPGQPPSPVKTAAAATAAAGTVAAGSAAAAVAAKHATPAATPQVTSPTVAPTTGKKLRRRFSWEAESGPSVSVAPTANTVVPPVNTTNTVQSPAVDGRSLVSSMSPAAGGPPATTPSPLSEAESLNQQQTRQSSASSSANAPTKQENIPPRTQPPVRSMLDIGPEEPVEPKSLAMPPIELAAPVPVAELPAQPVELAQPSPPPAQPVQPVQPVQPAQPESSLQRELSGQPEEQERPAPADQLSSPASPASPASPTSPARPLRPEQNPAAYAPGDGTGQFLTLRQCMAFESHEERMAKLAETRREYSNADSGLGSWLLAMTAVPEYSRASFNPLWNPSGSSPQPTRPIATHVNIPSGAHISHKGKEMGKEILAATGKAGSKAGKGLLALRKKGFHKKATN